MLQAARAAVARLEAKRKAQAAPTTSSHRSLHPQARPILEIAQPPARPALGRRPTATPSGATPFIVHGSLTPVLLFPVQKPQAQMALAAAPPAVQLQSELRVPAHNLHIAARRYPDRPGEITLIVYEEGGERESTALNSTAVFITTAENPELHEATRISGFSAKLPDTTVDIALAAADGIPIALEPVPTNANDEKATRPPGT